MSWEQFGSFNKNNSVFDLSEFYMGKAELYHVNLIDFEKVQFINCHLQEIIPVDVKWNFNRKAYSEISADHAREVFQQLRRLGHQQRHGIHVIPVRAEQCIERCIVAIRSTQ